MELFYNPELISQTEIDQTFVEREGVLTEALVSFVTSQTKEEGFTHGLILGQRGMGKTTLLLKLRTAFEREELRDTWQVLKFPEELYSVSNLADFYISVIKLLANETGDDGLLDDLDRVLSQIRKEELLLPKGLLEIIKDWNLRSGKRLLLLVENFDSLVEQIGDERDITQLAKTLKSSNLMLLIGTSTTVPEEPAASSASIWKLFKHFALPPLMPEQIRELLIRRAAADNIRDFEKVLDANASRLRVLGHFTGGNPRLVLMLYRVLTQSDVQEVRRAMEKLLDQVTPEYKAKIEILPPQQRKILDQIARSTARTLQGVTPSEVAAATRLSPNQVSTQLKRLSTLGYIRVADAQGRNTYYTLSEPLYAIWHRMRLGRDERLRMQWLIDFIKMWYDSVELGIQSARLNVQLRDHLRAERFQEALKLIDHLIVLEGAMGKQASHHTWIQIASGFHEFSLLITNKYIKPREKVDKATAISTRNKAVSIERSIISDVVFKGDGQSLDSEAEDNSEENNVPEKIIAKAMFMSFWEDRPNEALELLSGLDKTDMNQATLWITYGAILEEAKKYEESLYYWEKLRTLHPEHGFSWDKCGDALRLLGRSKEALECYDRAVELDDELDDAWFHRGCILGELGRHEEAIKNLDRALELNPYLYSAWFYRGLAYQEMGRIDEAIDNYSRIIEIQPKSKDAFQNRGIIFLQQGFSEKGLSDIDKALEISPEEGALWYSRGVVLQEMDRYEEALYSFEQAIKYSPDDLNAWNNHGCALLHLDRYEEAIASFDHILNMESAHHSAILNRGLCLYELKRYEEAIADLAKVIEANPPEANIWWLYGSALDFLNRYEEALESFNRAVELDPKILRWQMSRSTVLLHLERYEEAIKSFDVLLAIESNDPKAWVSRSSAHIWKFEALAIIGKKNLAAKEWQLGIDEWDEAVKAGKPSEDVKQSWESFLFKMLHGMTARKELQEFVREHIYALGLEEKMFPLARALDYLITGDESLIDRLSPEVKDVVQGMVEGIRSVDGSGSKPEVAS